MIKNQKSKIKNREFIILIALAAALFFFKLGSFSLYDAAETTYGEFIKQIRLTGEWLTMHYNGEIIFDKPPLYFWLATITTYIFGFNEFAIRFWAAASGVLAVITTYFLGKTFYNGRTAFLSAIIVMTAFQFLVQSRIAELDVVLTLLITLALLFFYLGYQTNNKKYYLLSYPPMGLAVLTKGLLGVALPAFAIFLFLLSKGELRKLGEIHPLVGIIITAVIGLPWYLIEYLIHGRVFLDFVFGFLFLSRFQTVVSGHPGPWYYYFLALLLGFAPWSQFLPYALWRTLKKWKDDPELLSLCFILPTLIVFSIAKTKLPNYVLPLYPFLAVIVGKLWSDLPPTRGMTLSNFLMVAVVILLTIATVIVGGNYSGPYQEMLPQFFVLAGILSAGTILSIVFFLLRKYPVSFAVIPTMVFVIAGYLILQTLPAVEKYKGARELGEKVSQNLKEGQLIAAYDIGNRPGVVFYNQKPIVFLHSEKEVIAFLKGKKGYCFTQKSNVDKFKNYGKILAQKGELVVYGKI